jgi:hypothetical protein
LKKEYKAWKPKPRENTLQKINQKIRRKKLIKEVIEIIIMIALIIYMLRDLYLDGELDFLFK